ncbi:MAG: hypothetical protein ACPLY9_03210 [Nitrososphaerales archaeon]
MKLETLATIEKNALLQFYAESKPNVVFICEAYGENKIQEALEQINTYLHSSEHIQEVKLEIERIKKNMPKTIIRHGIFGFIFASAFITTPKSSSEGLSNAVMYSVWIGIFLFIVYMALAYSNERQKCKRLVEKLKQSQSKSKLASKEVEKGQLIRAVEKTSEENKESEEKTEAGKDGEEPPKHDITYGEDTWEQEDDEWTEELDSIDEMEW